MRDRADLEDLLRGIDSQSYGAYKRLRGSYDLGRFDLSIDHVQVDPFAPPSKLRLLIDRPVAALPEDLLDDGPGRIAAADFLTRRVAEAAEDPVSIGRVGQQILERTHVAITPERIEARILVGLPASGRRIRGREAARVLTTVLPRIVETALLHENLDQRALREHVVLHRDQEHLRARLAEEGLVAFVGDGAILPRRSGDSDLPLPGDRAVPFAGPDSLRVSFDLPSGRTVTGMGVPEGVTVIVGGGYHGKSTLLRAIERGVHPHLAGDGREWVITRREATTVRAEDGRAVTGVDISPFISGLPSGTDTTAFSTTNASGSTSQAATLVEAVEAGARALLIDEDTSATNFMIRDERMRELIPAGREPITPFVDRVRPLHDRRGVSTVLVAGGSGAFFEVADHVIALDAYRVAEVTEQARRIAGRPADGPPEQATAAEAPAEADEALADADGGALAQAPAPRVPAPGGLTPPGKKKPATGRGRETIRYGKESVDLGAVSQIVDAAQTDALAGALDRLADRADGRTSLAQLVDALEQTIDAQGLGHLSPFDGHPGLLARPRRQEIHAAVNRYRRLALEPPGRAGG